MPEKLFVLSLLLALVYLSPAQINFPKNFKGIFLSFFIKEHCRKVKTERAGHLNPALKSSNSDIYDPDSNEIEDHSSKRIKQRSD